jgi:hypothetical protein
MLQERDGNVSIPVERKTSARRRNDDMATVQREKYYRSIEGNYA